MYQLYTGYLPFYDQLEKEMMDKILEAEPAPPREHNAKIESAIEAVILKLLQKDPDRRYQSAADLLVELKKIYDRSAVAGTRGGEEGAAPSHLRDR